VRRVEVLQVAAKGKGIKSRLLGFGVDNDAGLRLFHVQVDVPTTGYMQSEFRTKDARLELKLLR
jgi:hypothetical protein